MLIFRSLKELRAAIPYANKELVTLISLVTRDLQFYYTSKIFYLQISGAQSQSPGGSVCY